MKLRPLLRIMAKHESTYVVEGIDVDTVDGTEKNATGQWEDYPSD